MSGADVNRVYGARPGCWQVTPLGSGHSGLLAEWDQQPYPVPSPLRRVGRPESPLGDLGTRMRVEGGPGRAEKIWNQQAQEEIQAPSWAADERSKARPRAEGSPALGGAPTLALPWVPAGPLHPSPVARGPAEASPRA